MWALGILAATILALLPHMFDCRDWPPPPPYTEKAKMARYLAHNADWGVVSALSPDYNNKPFGTLQSFADGPVDNSTGVPYFYVSNMSDTYHNIKECNVVSFTLTEAAGSYCEKMKWDPEEPTCSRMTLVGKMEPVTDSSEATFAKAALFTRHPDMATWPAGHGWMFYKLVIEAVHLLDFFGGATHVPVKDYFDTKP